MSENRRHLNHIESLRAIAALSVSIFHFSAYYSWSSTTTTGFTFGAQGVEIFYLISGFIIPYSLYHSGYKIKNYFIYLAKRFIRLLPPYFATIILIQIIGIVLCSFLWGCSYDINFRQIVINGLFLADLFENYDWINPIFATLEVEVHFYLFIGLIFPMLLESKLTPSLVAASLLTLGLLTRNHDTFLVNSPYFIGGLSCFFLLEKGWKFEWILPLVMAFITLLVWFMWQDLIAALIGVVLIIFLPASFKFLNFTGKISYSYYLVHGLSGGWFLYFSNQANFGTNYPILMILSAMLISWIVAFGMYYIIEKPSIRFSKKLKY